MACRFLLTQREDTLKLGADVYVNSSNPDEMKNAEYTLDCLIVTINAAVDWTPYLAAMRANGAFVVLGAIPQPLEFPAFTLLMKNVSIQFTNIELYTAVSEQKGQIYGDM